MGGDGEAELEERWVNVLAHVYRAVQWSRVARGRSSYDIFEHRLQFAKYKPSVPEVLERLMNTLGLQAPPLPLEDVEHLRSREEEALEVLRKWTKLLALKAAERARRLKRGGK